MQNDKNDNALLNRLHIKNFIDLALILPKKIENLHLSPSPSQLDPSCTEEVKIISINNSPNKLSGTLYCKNWKINANFIIFNAKKFHYILFNQNKECILNAKMNYFNNTWQFINPKIIKQSGVYIPKYQIPGIKDENIKKLISKYINKENLANSGLKEKYIAFLIALQSFDEKSYKIYKDLDNFKYYLKYIEIFNFLKKLKQKKHIFKAYDIKLFDITKWLNNIAFKPTIDQQKAILDIKKDLSSPYAQRRVVMGDVGCGKTLVLLAAALMIYPKRAVLMAPTTILAQQLYDEAIRLLPSFMNIILVKSDTKHKDILEKNPNANLIIGTHNLMYFNELNAVLVMIDEQHRFGTNQRQKISDLSMVDGCMPHFIQFSATPIPRTLSMIQSELLNFSFIKQMPFKKNIKTFCIQDKDFKDLISKINIELNKNQQIAIIYPLVKESEKSIYLSLEQAKAYWTSHYEKVYITHGKDKNKDEILLDFKDNGNILLSTTVIEVGISLPRLSTIIIVGAERLGLATLHQLRGRVGRIGNDGFCYLYTKQKQIAPRLLEFAHTLDGFEIAELDLKNRLSGDLIDGYLQHGNNFNFFDFSTDEDILAEVKKDLA